MTDNSRAMSCTHLSRPSHDNVVWHAYLACHCKNYFPGMSILSSPYPLLPHLSQMYTWSAQMKQFQGVPNQVHDLTQFLTKNTHQCTDSQSYNNSCLFNWSVLRTQLGSSHSFTSEYLYSSCSRFLHAAVEIYLLYRCSPNSSSKNMAWCHPGVALTIITRSFWQSKNGWKPCNPLTPEF